MIVSHFSDVKSNKVETEGAVNVSIRWLIGSNIENAPFYMRQFEILPGGKTPLHSHEWEHEVYILEGKAEVSDGTKNSALSAGSFVMISAGEKHQFINRGEKILKFLCMIPAGGN